ncbi:GNAT family N-acetyltransferase [Streptomyces sp. NPDC052301]|uniref:GNAT family N-acetyltransferase n=1 Tax=Streptomyces sp. NPDC052301 TaxID=3365687 RepID=UPI0037D5A087
MSPAAVELREFTLADGSFLMSWIPGPVELLTWAGPSFTWPLDEPQIAAYAAESAAPGRWSWMGVDSQTGQVVGHASVRVDAKGGAGRLGRVLIAPEARGRGLGAGMLKEVLAVALDLRGLQRVELGVFSHNASAVRLYERLGFQVERVLPDVEQVEGRSWSVLQMSLACADWASARGQQREDDGGPVAQHHEASGMTP